MSSRTEEQAELEARADQQRERVMAVLQALDARRHPPPSSGSGVPVAPVILAVAGVVGLLSSRAIPGRVLRRSVGVLSSVTGSAGLTWLAVTARHALRGTSPEPLVDPDQALLPSERARRDSSRSLPEPAGPEPR